MRSERKRRRTFLARFMVLFMIINLLSGVNPSVVKAEETKTWGFTNNGETAGNQRVRLVETGLEDTYQDGKFDVKLEVEGSVETVTNNEKLDVVLVVDRSGSMKEEKRMENAKTAAKQFVDKLIDGGNGKVRVGLVSYGGKINDEYGNEVPNFTSNPLQNDKNILKGIIDGYNAYEGKSAGTFTQAALREANKLFEANNNKKILVLISDGLPTYSYRGDSTLDFKQREKADKNIIKEGYEIWSIPVNGKGKHDIKKWEKGYITDSYETGWIHKTKWTYVPYYVKLIPVIEGTGKETSANDKARTIAEAKNIKDKGVRIFSVGIGVDNNGKDLLTKVATPGNYNDANSSAGNLGKLLSEIADQLKFAVSNGDLELVMNDRVEFKNADDLKKIEVKVVNKNTKIEATDKSKVIKDTAKWNAATKKLSFSGITLDKDEVLNIIYNAELVETYKDGDFKPLNTSAVLYPKGMQAEPNNKLNFIIPNVKDMKTVNLTINKQWVGNKVPANVDAVKFNIKADGNVLDNQIEVKKADNWTKVINDLPKYKAGSEIKYTVEEIAGKDYAQVGDVVSATGKDGNLTFTATNRNTETINFTVKKEWSTTPDELKIDVAAKLYANGKLERTESIIDDEAIFKNLPKYDETGKEIKYTVKETLDVGGEEKDGKITYGEYNYKVDYVYTESGATITNTSTNASTVKFAIDVIKNWVGGSSTQELNFVFKNEKDGKEYTFTMTAAGQASQDRWSDSIELPKYNDDNTLATYTVTEEKVEGYTANKDEVTGINANNPIAEFTNTRKTKNITVTKQWKDTPESLKKDVEVVLTENGKVSNRKDAVKTIKNDAEHKAVYTNLPETDTEGNKIDYSVKENNVEAGFEANVTRDNDGNIIVTNTYKKLKEDTISVNLNKVWRESVGNNATFKFINKVTKEELKTLTLSAETKGIETVEDKKGNITWKYKVKDLRKYDDNAKLIEYVVVEDVSNPAFKLEGENTKEVADGGTVIFTNVRVKGKLTLKKNWIAKETFEAYFVIEGNEVPEIRLAADNNWEKSVYLFAYDLEGNPIQYTITEKKIDGYKADETSKSFSFVDSANKVVEKSIIFTNTQMLENQFTVHKTWVGEPAESISFGLFEEGSDNKVDTLKLTVKDGKDVAQAVWEGKFEKVQPKYKLDGDKLVEIKYVVKELDEAGKPVDDEVKLGDRTFKVAGTPAQDTPNTYNFTNTDITKTDISVTKTWFGKVPESGLVHFRLFKVTTEGLVQVDKENYEVEDSNSSKWKISFKNVASVDENGNKINYVIKEVDGEANALKGGTNVKLGDTNYKVSYDENDNIINTELIDLTVNKEWGKNVPEIAKQSVKFRITDDSRSDMNGKSFLLNEAKGWTKSFENLPLYNAKGEKINYTVVETEINGDEVETGASYTKNYHSAFEINVENAENITKSQTITIKNSIVNVSDDDSENRTINVVKGWSEGAERKSVTVKLYKLDAAKGEIVPVEGGEAVLREENYWKAEFKVPKKDKDGNEILYYAFETAVGDVKVDESKLSPNMYNEGYQIGEYEVSIAELTSDEEGAEIGNYGFYILNTAHNKEVKPVEKVTINVTKNWLVPTDSEYVQPVNVRLFTKKGDYLIPVSDVKDLTLDANNNWIGKFTDLDKYNDDNEEIEYYVAEVGIGDQTKEIVNFADLFGYSIGRYNVSIDGNGTDNVVITNDVALIDVTAVKNWIGATPRQAVEFTLYTKQGENLVPTGKTVTLNGTDENTVATFTELPRLDNEGKPVVYYVYETKIGTTPTTFNPTAVENMNYSVGVNGGVYAVTVSDNGTVGDKVVIISNSFTATPVIPSGNIPLVPVVTPIPTPTPTPAPNPDSPVVDIPNVPSPQGPATPVNDGDEDNGVTEIDEDDVPQDDGKEVKKDNKANKDTVDIADNKAPKGTPKLPKTGGETGNFLSIIGLGLIGLGLVIRRRR